ncbi:MAG: hypothetical protein EON57_12335, partial [Alphaproteobacteria bacterium]
MPKPPRCSAAPSRRCPGICTRRASGYGPFSAVKWRKEADMEDDLKKLGRIPTPKASDEARARAMSAAMAAFEAAENNATAPQGTEHGQRQSSIVTKLWSLFMSRKMMLASSALATLLIVPAAGYITIGMINDRTITLTEVPVADAKKEDDNRLRKQKQEQPTVAGRTEADTKVLADAKPKQPDATAGLSDKAEPVPEPVVAEQKLDAAGGNVQAPVTVPGDQERLAAAPSDADQSSAATSEMAETESLADGLTLAKPSSQAFAKRQKTLGVAPNEGVVMPQPKVQIPEESGDRFVDKETNPVKTVLSEPVSTFSIDVDTASYAYARQA